MYHHQLIRQLIAEIRELREELADTRAEAAEYYYAARETERHSRAEILRCEEESAHLRSKASSRDWQRQSAIRDLESAQSRGDRWDIERAMKRLQYL